MRVAVQAALVAMGLQAVGCTCAPVRPAAEKSLRDAPPGPPRAAAEAAEPTSEPVVAPPELLPAPAEKPRPGESERVAERLAMVERQIAARGVRDPRVLAALRRVPRHRFVPEPYRANAYEDRPLPVGLRQTISQPYIVGLMTELLLLKRDSRVLEIGTGSGYQAAILAELAGQVFSIELLCPLAERARATLAELGYSRVAVRCGDGYQGWPEEAPFDAIIVTAAPPEVPEALVAQLKPGGRMVAPVGRGDHQSLRLIVKHPNGKVVQSDVLPVRFVPMVQGEAP